MDGYTRFVIFKSGKAVRQSSRPIIHFLIVAIPKRGNAPGIGK